MSRIRELAWMSDLLVLRCSKKKMTHAWIKRFLAPNVKIDLALTLTLKQGVRNHEQNWIPIDRWSASTNVSHFLKRLNDELFKNASRRYHRRLNAVTSIEGEFQGEKRLHVHLGLEFPSCLDINDDFDNKRFETMINKIWSDTTWGHEVTHYQKCHDPHGWIKYIFKDGADSIDIKNVHLKTGN